MVKQSERDTLLTEIEDVLAIAILEEEDDEDLRLLPDDHDDEVYSEVDMLGDLFSQVQSSRYLAQRSSSIPQSHDFKREVFMALPPKAFRAMTRTTKQGFEFVCEQIQDHPVFHNESGFEQALVWEQLAVALHRLGCYGNGASISKTQVLWGVSCGSLDNYTDRVLVALNALAATYVTWPDESERRAIRKRMKRAGFPGSVGFIDGTTIPLSQKPAIHGGECFFDRKKRYSINAQVVCDDRRRIRCFYSGWPGSCADSTVYKEMQLAQDQLKPLYFSEGEYIIADSAYPADHGFNTVIRLPINICCRTAEFLWRGGQC